jgi:hypothetical protein
MVTIAAVNVGNYRGMGARYVNALFRGCARHLTVPFRFVCFTDNARDLEPGIDVRAVPPGLEGWYNKLALFKPNAFEPGERALFFDLDTIVLGNIDDVAAYDGRLAMLGDPRPSSRLGSGIMAWRAGEYDFIWHKWVLSGYPKRLSGDQAWIAEMVPDAVRLQEIFPGRLWSFKIECTGGTRPTKTLFQERWKSLKATYLDLPYPRGASIVYFHGRPKPDNCRSKWVREAWNG